VDARQSFPSILLGSQVFLVLSWMTLEKVPRNVASWRRLYLAAKPPHMGSMWMGYLALAPS
jgi:hypothetical protein